MRHIAAASRLAIFLLPLACEDAAPPPGPASDPTPQLDYDGLIAGAVPVDNTIVVDVSSLPSEDPADPRQAVGRVADLNILVDLSLLVPSDLSSRPREIDPGAIRGEGTGFVWTAVLESPGATALRLELAELFLPRHAALYLYNDYGDVVGPYTRRGPIGTGVLTTDVLPGERVTLQIHYDGADTARALGATRLVIGSASVLDDRFELARYVGGRHDRAFCSFNESCVQNASCSSIPAAIQAARDAVALLVFRSGGFTYICSGGLLADTDGGSAIPYLLTANHCIGREREADTLQTFFHFSTACGGSCAAPSVASTTGSLLMASDSTSDYTILRLDQAAPSGTAFLAFSTTPVASSNNTSLFRISHPGGAPQAYSTHRVDTSAPTCGGWPRGNWIYSRDTLGATEGGSSGSPVLNASGEIVGQLSGGCGTNVNVNCDAVNNATVDGAFAAYYSDVAPILDPAGGCTDADGDGSCVPDDCNDANAAVHPGAAEVCSDGIDNDCDGATDAADGDCSTCDLLPRGASCSDNSQCCSGNCKGKPGRKTCR